MADADLSMRRLSDLQRVGVQLAVDDFGTGYSSLGYMEQFPVDILKIDRSFVDGLGVRQATPVLQSIIELAQRLGVHIVAEGIERREQLEALQQLGCDLGQGYFFSGPVEANDLGTVGPIADLTQPAHGTAQVTASVLYTPDAGFVGTDSFTYTICSTLDVDVCATAVVTVAVLPVATGDVLATEAGAAGVEDVLANDTVGPDPVTILVSGPANGTATLAGGVLTYTPTDEFTGHDQLIYQVCAPDGPPLCAQALVLVEVSPDVNPILATTPQSTAIAIDVTANDFGDAGTPVVPRPPVHGTVTGGGLDLVRAIVGTGNVDLSAVAPLVYTPHPGYVGADTFLYTRCAESTTLCSETAVVVLVLPVEEPPTTTPPPSVPGAQDPGAGGGSGALSATGAAAAQLAALAVALLGAGVVLVGVNVRRQRRS